MKREKTNCPNVYLPLRMFFFGALLSQAAQSAVLDYPPLVTHILQFVDQTDKLTAERCPLVNKLFYRSCVSPNSFHTVIWYGPNCTAPSETFSRNLILRLGGALRCIKGLPHPSTFDLLLARCPNVTAADGGATALVNHFLPLFPNLASLEVTSPSRAQNAFDLISPHLPLCTKLKHITLHHRSRIGDKTDLSPLLHCPLLESIRFPDYHSPLVQFLADSPAMFNNLRALSFCKVDAACFLRLLERYGAQLQDLEIDQIDKVGKVAQYMAEHLAPGNLRRLTLYCSEPCSLSPESIDQLDVMFSRVGQNLEYLDIGACDLLNHELLTTLLRHCPALKTLRLDYLNKINEAFVLAIENSPCMKHLVEIDIQLNWTAKCTQQSVDAFHRIHDFWERLSVVHVYYVDGGPLMVWYPPEDEEEGYRGLELKDEEVMEDENGSDSDGSSVEEEEEEECDT